LSFAVKNTFPEHVFVHPGSLAYWNASSDAYVPCAPASSGGLWKRGGERSWSCTMDGFDERRNRRVLVKVRLTYNDGTYLDEQFGMFLQGDLIAKVEKST